MDKRVAIVTGASRGIGRAIAKRLAKDGRHVVAVARNEEQLKSLAAEIAADGGVDTVIASGRREKVLLELADGRKLGTRFSLKKK